MLAAILCAPSAGAQLEPQRGLGFEALRVSSILNAGEVVNQETVENIARHLRLGAIRLTSSASRFLVGLKITP